MSINVTIDGTEYADIKTISAFGKTIQLEEIKESTGESSEITAWDDSTDYSFGGIIKKIREAKATGTFAYQSMSTDYIQMFDTGLGDDWEGIVIIDEDATRLPDNSDASKNLWFKFVNKEGYLLKISRSMSGSYANTADITANNLFKIENGIYYAKSMYLSSNIYSPFTVGNTCKWFAW